MTLTQLHNYYLQNHNHYKSKLPKLHLLYNTIYLTIITILLLFLLIPKPKQEPIREDKQLTTLYTLYNYINNYDIAYYIYTYSNEFQINPFLITAIAKTESNFKQYATNKNTNNSTDKGIFQLNSNSFPELTDSDFYNLNTNIYTGIKHFKWCLDKADNNEIKALAIYNAGINKVKYYKVGEKTFDYIHKILQIKKELESYN